MFTGVVETDRLFILLGNSGIAEVAFPKRVLDDTDQASAFGGFLRGHTGAPPAGEALASDPQPA